MTELFTPDPNWRWREGAEALARLESVSSSRAFTVEALARDDDELRNAIRNARAVGVPEDGIGAVTGLDVREIDAIAGTVARPDPGSELANAKIQALASIEHLRRYLAYNYPSSVIREHRKMMSTAVTEYCAAQDALARKAKDG